jgi:hypothetical protein
VWVFSNVRSGYLVIWDFYIFALFFNISMDFEVVFDIYFSETDDSETEDESESEPEDESKIGGGANAGGGDNGAEAGPEPGMDMDMDMDVDGDADADADADAAAAAAAGDLKCVICMHRGREVALCPCWHFCCCCSCFNRLVESDPRCPICRKEIEYYQRVYQ